MSDELSAPLGKKKRRFSLDPILDLGPKIPLGRMMVGLAALILLAVGIRVMFFDDSVGGRPSIEVPINTNQNNNEIAAIATETISQETMFEGPRLVVEAAPEAQVDDQGTVLTIEEGTGPQTDEFDVFLDMQEETKYGAIPRISPQGGTPFETYARPSLTPQSANGKTLVAIVVSGFGLDEDATIDAIDRLPDSVTLGFAPYGETLKRSSLMARRQGHEILLELPMEPFDYPESDPGPHTLLTNQVARANLDNLFWLMSRYGGYIGVMNNLGARFTSSAVDFTPVMEELGTRGLGYFDDNSSNRSLSRQLASANQVPFARASLLLDTNPSRTAILAKLDALVEEAQANGKAVGLASALPVSINTITSWAASLEGTNVELVPASALMN